MQIKNKESSNYFNSVIDRLVEYAATKFSHISHFEQAFGLSNGYINQQLKGKKNVGSNILEKILKQANDLDPKWLLTGEGFMNEEMRQKMEPHLEPHLEPHSKKTTHLTTHSKKTAQVQTTEAKQGLVTPNAEIITVVTDLEGNSLIPVLDIAAAAGLPQNINNAQYFKNRSVFSIPWPQFRSGDYVIIQITGDSMHPTVYHGDWVFARRLYDYLDIKDSYIHIVVTRDAVLCKRVYDRIAKKKVLTLTSDNEAYPNYDEPIENVLALYKVEHRLTAVLRNENTDIKKELNHLKEQVNSINKRLNEL